MRFFWPKKVTKKERPKITNNLNVLKVLSKKKNYEIQRIESNIFICYANKANKLIRLFNVLDILKF